MVKLISCLLGIVFIMVAGCETVQLGGGKVQSCGIDMRYCSPGP